MKKLFSLVLGIIMLLSAMGVSAAEVVEEINVDDVSLTSYRGGDDWTLMETDVKDELEKRLIAAWTNLDEEVDVSDLEIHRDDLKDMLSLIIFENPLFYYVEKRISGHSNAETGLMIDILPIYNETDKSVIEAKWAEIDKATEEILLYISPDMTEFEKVMAVHDYMVFNYVYELDDGDQSMMIILDKEGVCAAYAAAFLHMMNVLGIECSIVRSEEMGHLWNIVKLDNEWYHVDVTWDDVRFDEFARVIHKSAFLSTAAIKKMGYNNFDMADYIADSTLYDNAAWRDDDGAIVTVDGVMYRVEGNNLVDENGNVIYAELDGGDGMWNLTELSYFKDTISAGLCEINGVLYFNTDRGIYSYNTETGKIDTVLEQYGICGVFADANVLRYSTYDNEAERYVDAGSVRIADVELAEPYYEDGKAVVRLYNDTDAPLWVISKGDTYKLAEITEKGVNTVKFDNGDKQTIYVWKNSLEPYFEKIVVSE